MAFTTRSDFWTAESNLQPAMTVAFQGKDPVLLDQVKPGDKGQVRGGEEVPMS